MEEKKSLNNKYQKIDIDETPEEVVEPVKEKPKKEKKAKAEKAQKQPKEKKVKEPKVKKEKTPKEPKPPKEKKVKEPKPPKVKKEKKKKWEVQIVEDYSAEISEEIAVPETPEVEEIKTETTEKTRRTEEIVLPAIKSVKQISGTTEKPKKEKKVKAPKEKKVKEPKLPKEKKPKDPKPVKEKKEKAEKVPKVKKEKTPKEPKQPKEKKPREPMSNKDYFTIGIVALALVLVAVFAVVKYVPDSDVGTDFTETTTESQDKLASVQTSRDGVAYNLIQSEIPDVFYGFSSDYKLQYYQYKDNKMAPVKSTGSVNATVDMGNQKIPVTIDYVELGGKIFGVGLFVANKTENVYFYDMLAFQLVNLPKGYEQDGKALLLATTSKNALTQKVTLWPESFVVDLKTGATSRFLKVINRNIDITTGAGVEDFCILTNESYGASGTIPFISAREYEAGSGQQVKSISCHIIGLAPCSANTL